MLIGSLVLSLFPSQAHAAEHSDAFGSAAARPKSLDAPPSTRAPVASASSPRAPAVSTPTNYTVRPGDTVSGISARFGLRTADVLALNSLTRKSTIYPGQVLRLTGAAPTADPAVPTGATAGTYTIQRGDTISGIAHRNAVSTAAVLGANGLQASSIIYPGQQITIPATAAAAPAVHPAPTSAPGEPAARYTIQRGDTISGIAHRNAVSTAAVLGANGLQASSIIYPGQKIIIPRAASTPAPAAAQAATAATAATAAPSGLDAEQTANAQLIIRVGRDLGVPDRGIAIALGAAMQESWLRNLDWGDRDSLGLFQQRPSTGWGSDDEVRDPVRSTRAFFGGASDPNGTRTRGLLDIPGWQSMSFAQAVQSVQVSAYPDRYARWEGSANAWLAAWG